MCLASLGPPTGQPISRLPCDNQSRVHRPFTPFHPPCQSSYSPLFPSSPRLVLSPESRPLEAGLRADCGLLSPSLIEVSCGVTACSEVTGNHTHLWSLALNSWLQGEGWKNPSRSEIRSILPSVRGGLITMAHLQHARKQLKLHYENGWMWFKDNLRTRRKHECV